MVFNGFHGLKDIMYELLPMVIVVRGTSFENGLRTTDLCKVVNLNKMMSVF